MTARQYVWKVLERTIKEDAYTGTLLRKRPEGFSDADWNLAVKIIYGTLANGRLLRYQWEDLKKGKLPQSIMILIDFSIYQLFMLRTASYAVIDEAVELSKSFARGRYSGVVNAILREADRRGYKEPQGSPREVLSLKTSVPEWLAALWSAHYGEEKAAELCELTLKEKATAFRVRPGHSVEEVLALMPQARKGSLAANAVVAERDPFNNQPFKKGWITVQDQASQLVMEKGLEEKHTKILEMCAAPGTKTIQMADLTEGKAEIVSLELYPQRAAFIEQALQKEQVSCVKVQAMDARRAHEQFEEGSFDLVALDAPCSGLGVLRDKPDRKLRIRPEDIDEVVGIQKELLDEAAKMCAEGGILLYSTCTLNKKENEKQIAAFLKAHEDFSLLEEQTVFPDRDDNDGFYYAKLKKG